MYKISFLDLEIIEEDENKYDKSEIIKDGYILFHITSYLNNKIDYRFWLKNNIINDENNIYDKDKIYILSFDNEIKYVLSNNIFSIEYFIKEKKLENYDHTTIHEILLNTFKIFENDEKIKNMQLYSHCCKYGLWLKMKHSEDLLRLLIKLIDPIDEIDYYEHIKENNKNKKLCELYDEDYVMEKVYYPGIDSGIENISYYYKLWLYDNIIDSLNNMCNDNIILMEKDKILDIEGESAKIRNEIKKLKSKLEKIELYKDNKII